MFDNVKFDACIKNGELFVWDSDLLDFLEVEFGGRTLGTYVCNIFNSHPKHFNMNIAITEYEDKQYINWNVVVILAMNYNLDKYMKYKDILEKRLNFQTIDDNNSVIYL